MRFTKSFFLLALLTLCACQEQPTSNQPLPREFDEKSSVLCQAAKDKLEMYFGIWKKEFLERNDMEQIFFDEHVSVTNYDIYCQWLEGLYIRVEYDVTYDWAVIKEYDQIAVLLYSEGTTFRYLPIKRDHLFNEEEISYLLDHNVYSDVTQVKTLDELKFSSYEAALGAFQKEIGGYQPVNVRLAFWVPGKLPRVDGYPYLIGFAVVDESKNECLDGYMNLVTGATVSHETACWVN